MLQTSKDALGGLSKGVENAAENLSEYRDFAVAVQAFQKKILHGLESLNSKAQSFFSELTNSMSKAIQAANQMISTTEEAESSVVRLQKVRLLLQYHEFGNPNPALWQSLKKSHAKAINLGETIDGSLERAEQSRDLVTQVQGSLQGVRNNEIPEMRSAFSGLHDSLVKKLIHITNVVAK